MSKVINFSNGAARKAINRANSLNSTGPRTNDGKAVSSQNALKHGLCSFAILEDEDPQAFANFRNGLQREYRPATPTENVLVEHIAQNQWLLDRVRRRQAVAMAADPMMKAVETFKIFHRYATGYERAFYKAIETLRKIQAQRPMNQTHAAAAGFVPQNVPPPEPEAPAPECPLPGPVEIYLVPEPEAGPPAPESRSVSCSDS